LKVKDAIRKIIDSCEGIYPPGESESIAFIVLDFIGFPRKSVFQKADQEIGSDNDNFIHKISKEIQSCKPIQYILGETEFYGLKFHLDENVLIPRSETEELVMNIVSGNTYTSPVITDFGTGSGCIAISLAKNVPDAHVYACDISKNALSVARKNAELNLALVHFFELDMLNPDFDKIPECNIIVSNPPYVLESEKKYMHKNVLKFEPHTALFVSDHEPLIFYKAIAKIAAKKLCNNGVLIVEINENFASEIVEIFSLEGLAEAQIIRDIHEKNRFVKAVKY
jgi:release factor glutamine methyltransferase